MATHFFVDFVDFFWFRRFRRFFRRFRRFRRFFSSFSSILFVDFVDFLSSISSISFRRFRRLRRFVSSIPSISKSSTEKCLAYSGTFGVNCGIALWLSVCSLLPNPPPNFPVFSPVFLLLRTFSGDFPKPSPHHDSMCLLPCIHFYQSRIFFCRVCFLCLCPRCAFRYPPTSFAALPVNFVTSSGLCGFALSVSFCIAPWFLFVFPLLVWDVFVGVLPFPFQTHTLFSRCIARASVVVLAPSPPCMDFVNQSILLCQCFHACLYNSLCLPHVTLCLFLIVSFFFLPGPPSHVYLPVVLPSKALLRNLSQITSMKTRAAVFSTCSRSLKTWGGLLVQKFHGNLHEAALGWQALRWMVGGYCGHLLLEAPKLLDLTPLLPWASVAGIAYF